MTVNGLLNLLDRINHLTCLHEQNALGQNIDKSIQHVRQIERYRIHKTYHNSQSYEYIAIMFIPKISCQLEPINLTW